MRAHFFLTAFMTRCVEAYAAKLEHERRQLISSLLATTSVGPNLHSIHEKNKPPNCTENKELHGSEHRK